MSTEIHISTPEEQLAALAADPGGKLGSPVDVSKLPAVTSNEGSYGAPPREAAPLSPERLAYQSAPSLSAKLVSILLAVSLLFPSCARPASLPWSTFSGMAADAVGAQPGACPGDDRMGISARIEHGKDHYVFWALIDEQGQGVFVLLAFDADDEPTMLYTGHSDAKDNDRMVIDKTEKFDKTKHGLTACDVLAPERA